MNAGAYGHQMEDVITETYCIDENGESCVLAGKDHEFGYRTSIIQKKQSYCPESKNETCSWGSGRNKGKNE
jgi:UDP-N-acetylenolpyruvoylglucosamine reductase